MSVFAEDALKGEHALITGATGGIGYETAKVLASMGADVTITGRREDLLIQLKEEIDEKNGDVNVFPCPADLVKSEERERLVAESVDKNGSVTMLINSAGTLGGGMVNELTQDELERVMHMNFTVPILLSQQIYAFMKHRKTEVIVNVASLSGIRGTVGNTAYAGSKFALIGFTQSFAVEAIQHGIRVNAVCPGYVDTEMGKNSIERKAVREGRSFEEQFRLANEGTPSGRISNPKEVANTIAFLLTDAASNIVGESVKISGGSVMH